MVEQRQSAIQRIQVGVIGLVVVLLFVTLASMVLDRVSEGPQAGGSPESSATVDEKNETPDEPLAELGVTPVAKDAAQRTSKGSDQVTRPSAPAPRQ